MGLTKEQTNKSVKQNRDPEVYLHKYSQVIFDKGANAIQMRKDSISIKKMKKWDIH